MSEANQGPGGAKGRARTVSAWGLILSASGIRGQTGRFGLVVFSSGVMRESPQLPPPPAHGPFSGGRGGPGMWQVKFQGSPPNLGQGQIASLLGNSLQNWVLKQHLPRPGPTHSGGKRALQRTAPAPAPTFSIMTA